MKKVLALFISSLVIGANCYAMRVPMWRKYYESDNFNYFYDVDSLRNGKGLWSFGSRIEKKDDSYQLSSIIFCKPNGNGGLWSRQTNMIQCENSYCERVKDDDWKEYTSGQNGYSICTQVLPLCEDGNGSRKGFCRH